MSPPKACFDRCVTIVSTSGRYTASLPAVFRFCINFSGFNLSSGASCSSRATSRNNDAVCIGECRYKFVLKNISPRRVRARFKNRPDFFTRIFQAQGLQRLANRRRVMAEIINHRDPTGHTFDFHAPLDAFERVERRLDLLVGKAAHVWPPRRRRARCGHLIRRPGSDEI